MEKLLGLPLMVALFLMLVIPPPICSLRLMVTGYVLMSKCQWPKWKFTGQTNCEISLDKSAQLEGKNIIKVQWRAGVLQHHQWRTGQGRQCQRGASGLAPCHVVFSSNYKCTCKVQVHMYKVQVHVQNTSAYPKYKCISEEQVHLQILSNDTNIYDWSSSSRLAGWLSGRVERVSTPCTRYFLQRSCFLF